MHIYFSGIGGVGLGPLAEIALDAGFIVSGSDAHKSPMYNRLKKRGARIHLGQDYKTIQQLHAKNPIDWFVQTSALPQDHAELQFVQDHSIKNSKRDEFLAYVIAQKNLKLIAVAGTHGKTTTTAMLVWALKQLNTPVSYSIGTTIGFGPSGSYEPTSDFFVYECDEFDRNFLNFSPDISLITTIGYDHPDTYPTEKSYREAFAQFIDQSKSCIAWQKHVDAKLLNLSSHKFHVIDPSQETIRKQLNDIPLAGQHYRENAYLVFTLLKEFFNFSPHEIMSALRSFPGTSRRFEKLASNLYSDYAHHPIEIKATLQLARELHENVSIVYQPHQNIRQHEVQHEYAHCFDGARRVYWLPTYLSREDPTQEILTAKQLSSNVKNTPVEMASLNDSLWHAIAKDSQEGVVIVMGAGDIDAWTRKQIAR